MSNKLYVNISVIGLENLKSAGTDKAKIESICTSKTNITLKILEA